MPVCVSSSAPSKVLDPEVAVNKEEYQVFEELGRGRFGTVFHCFQHRGLRLHQNGGLGEEIAKLFPNLFGQPSAALVLSDSHVPPVNQKLKISVVLSGGQAPGGHNVISGIFNLAEGSTLYGFRGGPAGIKKCKYVELTSDYIYPYRNQGGFDMIRSGRDKIETPEQFKQAEETVQKLDLEGLVVIGGDDSNTNACLLAEHFNFGIILFL
ncbi:Pyrophosphate--fructose 6-phosphate 1-phosphotransferase subunit beta 2 [Glycine soja]|uniref:Pyrophosphate--fructose 6-phosphate 1-phosphotransferase subunit beta 2 n=1 Tax=Glycine soja TaxID=3848 RepID=A0A445HPF3_GLYSO|nr:Pyrophosphate--fructose 6-phosphate 1-phosphotransferase subunit beta 2 [Glycine soja]